MAEYFEVVPGQRSSKASLSCVLAGGLFVGEKDTTKRRFKLECLLIVIYSKC